MVSEKTIGRRKSAEPRYGEQRATMQPFVSIIVPVKNEERRLPALLAALRALDYPRDRYEIIVADNGSSDSTRAVITDCP